jgi:hypothetical protein
MHQRERQCYSASRLCSALRILGNRSELDVYMHTCICFILVSLSLLVSPGIAGIAAYLSQHRWASFVPLASLRIAGNRSFHSSLSQKCYKCSVNNFEENVRRRLIESSRPFFSNHSLQCVIQCAPIDIHSDIFRERLSKFGR